MPYRTITPQEISIVSDIQARAFRFPSERYLEAYNGSGRFDHTALRLLENETGQAVAALNIFTRPISSPTARPLSQRRWLARRCALAWPPSANSTRAP